MAQTGPQSVDHARRWPAVFEAYIVSTEQVRRRRNGMLWRRHVAIVGMSLRGPEPGSRVVIYPGLLGCHADPLEDGHRYVFFGRPDRYRPPDRLELPPLDGEYLQPGCNPTVLWSATDPTVMAFLQRLQAR